LGDLFHRPHYAPIQAFCNREIKNNFANGQFDSPLVLTAVGIGVASAIDAAVTGSPETSPLSV
jgi:hypothetical protein